MLTAGHSELWAAFVRLTSKATADSEPDYLLLFYAVECGLKVVYLRRYRLRTTAEIADSRIRGTHNLAEIVKELRVPAAAAGPCPSFRLSRDNLSYDVSHAHEAWRYGIRMVDDDQRALVEWLRRVITWIRGAA